MHFGPASLPPRSNDVTPLDCFIGYYVRGHVCRYKATMVDALDTNIFLEIPADMLEGVYTNWNRLMNHLMRIRGWYLLAYISHEPKLILVN